MTLHASRTGWITDDIYSRLPTPLSYEEVFEQQHGTGALCYRFTFVRFSERDTPIEYFAHNSPPPPTLTA